MQQDNILHESIATFLLQLETFFVQHKKSITASRIFRTACTPRPQLSICQKCTKRSHDSVIF